jgi:NAD(P)-dependent dehydrogenase (short-subunit alcohol dehydrogenase family)
MHQNLEKTFSLKEKVVIITGGCGMLGLKHAEAIIEADGIPVLLDINQTAIDKGLHYLHELFPSVTMDGFVVDITKEQDIIIVKNKILNIYNRIDALINNAANNPKMETGGLTNETRFENLSDKIWQDDIAVGLTGAFYCSRIFGSTMAKNCGGVILNISSDLGLIAPDQRIYRKESLTEEQQPVKPVTYSVIKHGLIGLTKYIATYWAKNNVRCNALCPGGVFNGQEENFVTKLTNLIPLSRMADKDEYKAAIVFLCSNASSYMTGSILTIEGGRSCW